MNFIDAHAHIFPSDLLGQTDSYSMTYYDTHGNSLYDNGRSYQKMPLICHDSCYCADTLIRMMDELEIEAAVIMNYSSPFTDAGIIEAVKAYPDRLRGAMGIDPKDNSCLEQMKENVEKGLTVLKIDMNGNCGLTCQNRYPGLKYDDMIMMRIWETAGKLGIPIAMDLGGLGNAGYQPENLRKAVEANRGTKFVICHLGFPYTPDKDPLLKEMYREVLELAKMENVWFDCCALPDILKAEEYPYPSSVRAVRDFADQYGMEKVLWGSDVPGTLTHSTYRQLRNMYLNSPLFTDREKELLFYHNARKIFFEL